MNFIKKIFAFHNKHISNYIHAKFRQNQTVKEIKWMRVYFFGSWLSSGNLCKNSRVCNCIQIMLFLRRTVVLANDVWRDASLTSSSFSRMQQSVDKDSLLANYSFVITGH